MSNNSPLSPEKYILTRARSLPISNCYVNSNWQEIGMANIMVTRKHSNGNFTLGIYLVDTFALGVKVTFYRFNMTPQNFEILLNNFRDIYENGEESLIEKTDYVIVHNIIYGAIAFAEEHGYHPSKDFNLTKHILEEDDENTELIEYEFGKDGKPVFITRINDEE